ncbi:MAG: ammonium transporter, partial [Rubrimonas sp.]
MKLTPILAAAALALTATAGFAQEATEAAEAVEEVVEAAVAFPDEASPHTVFILNTLLFLIGGFLVMWMAAGFAMLEAGLVRTKNVAMQCTKNIALFSLAGVMYYLIGYNLMYPLGNWSIGSDETGGYLGAFGVAVMEAVGLSAADADDIEYASTASDFFFQLMFCATTASIVSGTLAERIKLWPFLIFSAILTGVIYPIPASWKWGGGFHDTQLGFLD